MHLQNAFFSRKAVLCVRSRSRLPIDVRLSRSYKALPTPCLTGNSSLESSSKIVAQRRGCCCAATMRRAADRDRESSKRRLRTALARTSDNSKSLQALLVCKTKKHTRDGCVFSLAQRRGFEPPVRFRRTHDFQSCSLNHSDISA